MPITIHFDKNVCAARIQGAWDKSLFAISSQILGDCNRFVKIDTHAMEASSYVHSQLGQGKLVWSTPYAKRQYWEIQTSLTPGRTWKWCETAKSKYKLSWQKMAEKLMREKL